MPETHFCLIPNNPVEKMFWGRANIDAATAQFYFTKQSLMQHLLHQLKYMGNREIGYQLGKIMGGQLIESRRFECDALIPLPLFPAKQKKRGYNQASVICEGMSAAMDLQVWEGVIQRPQFTSTQTKKGRIERWKNVEGKFEVTNQSKIEGKHLLLVDDVVTTGATLEHCASELLKIPGVTVSLAALCIAR